MSMEESTCWVRVIAGRVLKAEDLRQGARDV
jgi:hypothetical protein